MGSSNLYVETSDGPRLNASVCSECGYIDFPPQHYGCRQCGAYGDALTEREIGTEGTVNASAEVHSYPGDRYPVPFTVAAVTLDAGPVTRVTMADTTPLSRGDRVVGVIVDQDDGDNLRFTKVSN